MKRFVLFVLLICLALSVFAQDIVTLDLMDMDIENQKAFMFLYGYEAILEELCKGCFLALDVNLNYIGGWRTEQTPDDFAVNIPVNTITTVRAVPVAVARIMFQLLDDNETVVRLLDSLENVYLVCMFLPSEGMTVANPSYNYGQRLLEEELARHGVNPGDFYAFMETQTDETSGKPITMDSMVATMYRGDASAKDIVLDGLGRMEELKNKENRLESYTPLILQILLYSVAGIAGLALIYLFFHLVSKHNLKKADRLAEMEKHNAEISD